MSKHILLLLLLIAIPFGTVMADEYNYLTFTKSDGTASSINISNLKLSVSGSNIIATNGSETLTLTLADLAKMAFTESSTAISAVTTDSTNESVEVFSITGAHIGTFANADEARGQLKTGVYILKSKSLTSKLSVR